jgi:predicted DNA-binding transcriptional regulator AlpA
MPLNRHGPSDAGAANLPEALAPGALPAEGFVRLSQILAPRGPFPVSRASWWAGVASGRFPRPVKLGPRTTAWRVSDLRTLLKEIGQ